MRTILLLIAVISGAVSMPAQQPTNNSAVAGDVIARRQQLLSMFDEEWQYELRHRPEFATALGDKRHNDGFSDESPQAQRADVDRRREFLANFAAVDASGFSTQDSLSRSLMIRNLREDIEDAQFKPWEMPVNQFGGPHTEMVDLVSLTPFDDVHDYENYIARLHGIPSVFAQFTSNMRLGMHDRLMPPRYLLEKAAAQAQEIAKTAADASPFKTPLDRFPSTISATEQERLRTLVMSAISHDVIPAYRKFADFLRDEYAPHGRTEPGVWSLPDGDARYRFAVRKMTTTDLTPDQIHELGLKQLAETEAEMLAVAHDLGFKDLASLNDHIKKERKFYATSGQQVLDLYTKYTRQMEAQLPKLFGTLPRNSLIVVPMDTFRAKDSVPADYTPGAADGSRPGRINVNEYDPEHRLLLNLEAIAYHEGVPGHHLQFSTSQELPGLPAFRRNGDYTAFTEGWALYSERLGKEIGFYQDPYSNYGRLENEMWRDIRLVIDTGVHSEHWSREQMVEYFHRYTAMDEPNIQTEVDRYIAWPGQALAYKLGQLEILKLRAEAKQKLGEKFDLRAFHDEIVGNGPLPLDVLEAQVEQWIASQPKRFQFLVAHLIMERLKLGDFELSIFSDGTYPLDGGAFFGVVPRIMWSRRVTADAKNFVTAGLNSLLIRTGRETVLVETGMGNKLSDRMRKFYGQPAQLLTNLAAGGVRPEDIDIVINTHLHFDHCGWNTVRGEGRKLVPTFPRAKYYAPEGEWQYARRPSERDAISYIPDNYDPLVQTGQMTLLKGGEEVVPGISVKTFPGHTASMQAVIVNGNPGASTTGKGTASAVPSESEKGTGASAPAIACYISDLIPTTAHIDLTWGMSFDLYPVQTIESKKHYYAKAIPEKWLTVFTHDPKTPWAYVERDELGKMVTRGV